MHPAAKSDGFTGGAASSSTPVSSSSEVGRLSTAAASPSAVLPVARPSDDPTRTSQGTRDPDIASPGPVEKAPQPRDPTRYRILAEHGRGGLGRVSRAHDLELGRDIAIKELLSHSHVSEVRFLREALITARLEHPGIVPVYEAGRWPDGTPFYAMKLVAGRSLRNLIAECSTVDERIGLLHHVIAVADAIAYAHGRNIIHRDLKPSNVIIGDFGETVVIDWGLAKDLSAAEESTVGGGPFRAAQDDGLTSAGTVLGTPAYMAPEQKRGEPVDARADVYAIGGMLWDLCTLERIPPGYTGRRSDILRRSGTDPDLAAIIDKALAPHPASRYADAGALAADLRAFKSGARIGARRYSLLAMLAHWTRRHRTSALSGATVIALSIIAALAYVRNVSKERDRADAALDVAQRELERAQLAEASLLLEKDPTSARQMITALSQQSPQHALLLSRANLGAATRTIGFSVRGKRLVRNAAGLALLATDGTLESLDLDTGVHSTLAEHLVGPITSHGDGWLYAQRPFGADVAIGGTPPLTQPIEVGNLFEDANGKLVQIGERLYALDRHDLYRLSGDAPALVRPDIRSVAGTEHVLLLCSTTNDLEIIHDDIVEEHSRCAEGGNPTVARGDNYAALLDADHLLLVRGGAALELPAHVQHNYELALSASGLLALSDFSDKAWFVKPGGNRLELAPAHASLPTAVAAEGDVAAWGYADGVVVALDTKTGSSWEFKGHSTFVVNMAVDPDHRRLVSLAGSEIRVWPLSPDPLTRVANLPGTTYNAALSLDQRRAALDGHDGTVRIWTLASGALTPVHHHRDVAYGVAWLRGASCSAGFDNKVMCTSSDGETRDIPTDAKQIRWLTSSPDQTTLAMTFGDGRLATFDGALKTLYTHRSPLTRTLYSDDGQLLATGTEDGSIVVYDLAHRAATVTAAHRGRVASIAWQDHDLWTSGVDGTMIHWRYADQALTRVEEVRETGTFRFLHPIQGGWVGNTDGHVLLVSRRSQPAPLRFDLERHVERVEVSPDERYVAATVAGLLVIVDLAEDAIATVRIASDGIGYVGFIGPGLLSLSTSRALYTLPLSSIRYSKFLVQ